ncbi:hypothetical protein [Pontibacter actiniarum]|nr:hypothetical protein [Pontibacter actiniarum]
MIETYQINQLKQLGHEVQIWYLGDLFGVSGSFITSAPAIKEYAVVVKSFKSLKEKVKGLEKNTIIFSQLGLFYYYPVLYKMVKSREDLIWVGRVTKSVPLKADNRDSALKAMIGTILHFKLYKPLRNVFLYAYQKVVRKYGKALGVQAYQPDFLMASNFSVVPAYIPKEKVVVTHTDDYNIHLLNIESQLEEELKDAIVFLDQMIFHHPDLKELITEPVDVDKYYRDLNIVLDQVSKMYGKPVIIAGHPESEKYPDYVAKFEGKRFIVGESLSLVKYSFLVLTHFSTAVNFAVIYDKPLIMLESNSFDSIERVKRSIRSMASELKVPTINIEKPVYTHLDIDALAGYKGYKSKYIKSEGTPEELSYPYVVNYISKKEEYS